MWADNAICICCLSQKFLQVWLLPYKCDLCVCRSVVVYFVLSARVYIVTLSLSNEGNVFGGYLTIFGGVGPLVSISWRRFHTKVAVFQTSTFWKTLVTPMPCDLKIHFASLLYNYWCIRIQRRMSKKNLCSFVLTICVAPWRFYHRAMKYSLAHCYCRH